MPYQEHLQETRRQFAYASRFRSAFARLALLICACLAAPWTLAHAAGMESPPIVVKIESARAQTLSGSALPNVQNDRPPTSGWVQVSLPDVWSKRWPTFDGVVWYRLTWHQAMR